MGNLFKITVNIEGEVTAKQLEGLASVLNGVGMVAKKESQTTNQPKVVLKRKRKTRKGGTHSIWTQEEVDEVSDLLSRGFNASTIAKSPLLRQRHTKVAVLVYVNKFAKGVHSKNVVPTTEKKEDRPIEQPTNTDQGIAPFGVDRW